MSANVKRRAKLRRNQLRSKHRKQNYENRLEKLKNFLEDTDIPVKRRNAVYAVVTEGNKFIPKKVNEVVMAGLY